MIPSPVVMTSWRMRTSVFLFAAGVPRRDHVALYLCQQVEAARKFVPTYEIAATEWFDVDAPPADTTSGTRWRIEEVFHGAPADPVW
ncbi:MAG: hypothetical protein WD230_06775 [Cucumibacter sp.]